MSHYVTNKRGKKYTKYNQSRVFLLKDEPLPPDRIRSGDVLTFPLLKKLSAKADIEPPYEELSRSADPLELDFDMEEESEEDAYLKKTEVMKRMEWRRFGKKTLHT